MYNCFVNTQHYSLVNFLDAHYTPELVFFTTFRSKMGGGGGAYFTLLCIIFSGLRYSLLSPPCMRVQFNYLTKNPLLHSSIQGLIEYFWYLGRVLYPFNWEFFHRKIALLGKNSLTNITQHKLAKTKTLYSFLGFHFILHV